jgi:hypothetical protein
LLAYELNFHQSATKLHSRIDLAASRTTSNIRLEPKDIVYDVPDRLATGDFDDMRYLDPKFQGKPHKQFDPNMVMDDGCGKISAWLASRVADIAGESLDRRGFQARVAGAKGIWIPADDPYQADPENKPPGPHL